jgi:hypothetical protein
MLSNCFHERDGAKNDDDEASVIFFFSIMNPGYAYCVLVMGQRRRVEGDAAAGRMGARLVAWVYGQ